MNPFYTDGAFDVAVAATKARAFFPIEGDPAAIVYEQDFTQNFDDFSPLAISTEHPDISGAYLIRESPLTDLGGGVARWTRVYATIPPARNEYESFPYTFPGFYGYWVFYPGEVLVVSMTGRYPVSKVVRSRLYHEYFLTETGQTYTTPGSIPVIPAFEVVVSGAPTYKAVYLVDQSNFPNVSATVPTQPQYQAYISGGTEIVAEASRISRWAGNIWERVTRYVVAE